MSVIAFCHATGYRYAHTPLAEVAHTSGPDEVAAWENAFNLGQGEICAADVAYPIVPVAAYMRRPQLWFHKVVVAVEYLHPYTDRHTDVFDPLIGEFRERFAATSEHPADGRLTIAVHIRRGDVNALTSAARYTGNAILADRIRRLQQSCREAQLPFRTVVHSQGRLDDFRELAELGCEFRLDAKPLDSLSELVAADVLVMAKSSYSYVAAMLCEGIVIYEPFWHAPHKTWLPTERIEDFATLLAARRDARR
ncbi:MAG: hypothetical protein U1E56_00315 [Bauldia sp.]